MGDRSLYDFPHGFVLSEAALYAFICQDVYPDVLSFATAIPVQLKPLFLIPIKLEHLASGNEIAAEMEISRTASVTDVESLPAGSTPDGSIPTGATTEADWFGTKTFVNDDNEPTIPSSEPGSIFQIDDADSVTHHQEYNYDQNNQVPGETTFNEDIDMTQYGDYPYRTKELDVRHSSISPILMLKLRVAIHPEELAPRTPDKIKNNAKTCEVSLVSYDKGTRVFTFAVNCGNGAKTVQTKLSDIDQVAMSCNCNFWRWNGPEFHAEGNQFMLGQPFGSATTPDIRDPDRKYWLCKHAYAVLRRLDNFVQDVVDDNWDQDEDQLLDSVDENWDKLEGKAKIPLEEIEEEDIDLNIDWDEPEPEPVEEPEPEESEDVDLSELEEMRLKDFAPEESIEDYQTEDLTEDYETQEPENKEETQDSQEDYETQEEPAQTQEESQEDYETQEEKQEPEDSDEQ